MGKNLRREGNKKGNIKTAFKKQLKNCMHQATHFYVEGSEFFFQIRCSVYHDGILYVYCFEPSVAAYTFFGDLVQKMCTMARRVIFIDSYVRRVCGKGDDVLFYDTAGACDGSTRIKWK